MIPTDPVAQTMSWETDYAARTNPELLTRLLRHAVPVLDFLDFRVVETAPGYAKALLPLSARSANQHGVHQAAVLAIAADYVGGIALGTLATGAPIIGAALRGPLLRGGRIRSWTAPRGTFPAGAHSPRDRAARGSGVRSGPCGRIGRA